MVFRGTGVPGFAKGRAFVAIDRGQRNPYEDIPPGSVLVARTVFLSDSVMINFNNVVAMVMIEDPAGHVSLLARGLGIPAVVGVNNCLSEIYNGDRVLVQNLDVIVNPDLSTLEEFDRIRRESDPQLSLDLR
jgi:phosphotransferase system enzyme I (PtsI)